MMRYRHSSYRSAPTSTLWHWVAHFLFVGIICFLLFRSAGVSGIDSTNFQNIVEAQVRSEMELAISSSNTLSRLGATSTSPTLGKIRQYVHGMEVANQFSVSIYGEMGRLFSPELFTNVYTAIDAYDNKLVSGASVSAVLTNLNEALDALDRRTREL